MLNALQRRFAQRQVWIWPAVVLILLGAAALGRRASVRWLVLLGGSLLALALLSVSNLGLPVLISAALIGRFEISTGTEVAINVATVMVFASLAVWVIDMMRHGKFRVAPSRVNLPLLLFLLSGLVSLAIGSATWDPVVPRSSRFLVVQLAQWGIFALSAGAFWLMANLRLPATWLRRLLFLYLGIAGAVAGIFATGGQVPFLWRIPTFAVMRAPFWLLLMATACGQLLFNEKLSARWRRFLVLVLALVVYAVFFELRSTASHWVGVVAVVGVLAWLRWPRLRWLAIALLAVLVISGMLTSAVYDFAGGDAEWEESGGSRLALIERVIEVTMRNPITGLGPAAYRIYARMEPLEYGGAYWVDPSISSHNNYVDLFSHVGLLGLGLFLWFAVEVILLGLRLRKRYTSGFGAGYVNAMLAAWAGALVVMLFADWILPYVYNVGFNGFQASILVWLFLGGLVALENADASQVFGTSKKG